MYVRASLPEPASVVTLEVSLQSMLSFLGVAVSR